MKKLLLLLLVLFLTQTTQAQDCGNYFSFKKGMKFELTNYDKKDKPAALLKYEIVDYKPVNGGTSLVMAVETYDMKGKLLAKGESAGKCVGGTYFTDVRNISSDMVPKSADITMTVSGDQLAYPAKLNPGDKLNDATISIKSSLASGMSLMNINATITDRQVAGNESVTTPAGTFECVKITYTLNVRFMGNRTLTVSEFLAPGIGVVKSEQTDNKGRKQSSTLLTKLEK